MGGDKKDVSEPRKDIEKYSLKDITICHVYLGFHFAPFIDLESFKEECKKQKLPVTIETEDKNQMGLVLVKCNSLDLLNNLKQVQNDLSGPIKKAITNTSFENEVRQILIKTDYFKSVLKYIQDKYKELHEKGVTKEEVADDLYNKYGHLFGKEGAMKAANLFSKDKEQIITNYMKLQDYILKHFSIEFFVQQQVEQGYYLIVNIEDRSKLAETLQINEFNYLPFKRKELTIPAIGKIENVFWCDEFKNILVTVNPKSNNKQFLYSMLRLKKLNTGILFINFLFRKQSEGIKIDLENFEIESERIKTIVLNYDTEGIDLTVKKLENFENIAYSYLDEFLMPIKRFIDQISPRTIMIEKQTIDEIFNKDVKIDGIVGKAEFNPPSWFSKYLFIGEFKITRELIYSSIEDIKTLLKFIRELKEYLMRYQHELKLRKKEQFEATRKIIFETLKDLVDIIKKVLIGFPPK